MNKLPYTMIRERIIKKNPDDPKRNKRSCIYYDDGYCFKHVDDCRGSPNCMEYKVRITESAINNTPIEHKTFKQIVNCYSKEFRPKKEVKNITIIIGVNENKFNDIKKQIESEGKYTIDISFKNESMYEDFDKLFITQVFLECDKILYKCYTVRNYIYGSYNDKNVIRFRFKIGKLYTNQILGKHSKLKWSCNDKKFGQILFYKNQKHKKK